MKKIAYLSLGGLALSLLLSSASFARDLIILNACDFPLTALRLQATGEDIAYNLLEQPLAPQAAIKVRMKDDGPTWNLTAVDPDEGAVTYENISFEDINQIHIKADGTVEIYR